MKYLEDVLLSREGLFRDRAGQYGGCQSND